MVDAAEFLKKVTPAGQRSRVAPFWNDITKLRESGCTLEQMCAFLAENGVQISIAGLSKYIKRREEKGEGERVHASVSSGQTTQGQRLPAPVLSTQQSEKPAAAPRVLTPEVNSSSGAVMPGQGGKNRVDQLVATPDKNFSLKALQSKQKDTK